MKALFRDRPDAIDNTVRLAERLQFSLENLGYDFPDFPCRMAIRMDSFLRTITFSARSSATPRSAARSTANQRGAGPHPKARVLRLFSDRLGHRQFLPRTQHHGAGRGSAANSAVCFCLGITPVDPVEQSSRLRTFPERRPQRLARHRSRSAERRSARKRDPGNLPALRQTRRGHDRERHHLSRPKRRARNRQSAQFCRRIFSTVSRIFSRTAIFRTPSI